MVELRPLITVPPPPLEVSEGDPMWLYMLGVLLFVGVIWRLRKRLYLWWLRLTVRPECVQAYARRALKVFVHLSSEQRRVLELIAFAPDVQPEHLTQLRALLREVRP